MEDMNEFHSRLADAPSYFRRTLRDYLLYPYKRNSRYITGYLEALVDAHLIKAGDTVCYWLDLIDRVEDNDTLARKLIAEMDNPPAAAL